MKSKKHWYRKVLAIVLAFSMMFSVTGMIPAFAQEGEQQKTFCGNEEHSHADECYAKGALTCEKPEHVHSLICFSNPDADEETADAWNAICSAVTLTGIRGEDLAAIAGTQIGYTESTANYEVKEDGTVKGYSRYGAWNGTPYADWSALFAGFCLSYAGIPESEVPAGTDPESWIAQLQALELFTSDKSYQPKVGDIVFTDTDPADGKIADTVGIICEVRKDEAGKVTGFVAIEGDVNDQVQKNEYELTDGRIVGFCMLPENPDMVKADDSDAAKEPADAKTGDGKEKTDADSADKSKTDKETADNDSAGSEKKDDTVKDDAENDTEEVSDEEYAIALTLNDTENEEPVSEAVQGNRVWYAKAYYQNQGDRHHVDRTADFQLKYQMEFHTDEDLDAESVEIRIPAVLFKTRDGKEITPEDVGVPQGAPGHYTETKKSPFNYAYETIDETLYVVFRNYKAIPAGTNAVCQVLYPLVAAFNVIDGTTWELTPEAAVKVRVRDDDSSDDTANTHIETQTSVLQSLTGTVDTHARVTAATKSDVQVVGKSYTPALYTADQVNKFVKIPASKLDFDKNVYAVWQISADVNYNQAFEIYFDDDPYYEAEGQIYQGQVVGVSEMSLGKTTIGTNGVTEPVASGEYAGMFRAGQMLESKTGGKANETAYWYVVTSYPKENVVSNETILKNEIDVVLHPYDDQDYDTKADAEDSFTYAAFEWHYFDDLIVPEKYYDQVKPSWTSVYKNVSAEGRDLGGMNFTSVGLLDAFYHAYDCTSTNPNYRYIPGKYDTIITTDDFLYARVLSVEDGGDQSIINDQKPLSKEDYYFDQVTVTVKDGEYDFYEDQAKDNPTSDAAIAEAGGSPIDRKMDIYAMFADNAGDGTTDAEWEYVDSVPWNATGNLKYTFPESVLSRGVYRVKAVHNTVDSTVCNIVVNVTIRNDSPVFQNWCDSGASEIKLWNLVGLLGTTQDGEYFQYGANEWDENYDAYVPEESSIGLIDFTRNLYGVPAGKPDMTAMRDTASADLKPVDRDAKATKSASVKNDPVNGQYNVKFTLSAYESYILGDSSYVPILAEAGMTEPQDRKDVVFYDLLPKDVQFDPNVPIMIGTTGGAASDMKVTVDESDIIPNWRGTGRTMVVFHVSYLGEDPSEVTASGKYTAWKTGYTVTFGAYCRWEDAAVSLDEQNIVAYMPVSSDKTPLVGAISQVACDDGKTPKGEALSGVYEAFASGDLNDDGITDIRNVLYATTVTTANGAIAAEAGIHKEVKADTDLVSAYGKSTAIDPGKGYSYRLTVQAAEEKISDIVVYDHLENAYIDRYDEEPEYDFETPYWQGEFTGVDTSYAESLGIVPKVYYNTNRDARLPEDDAPEETPDTILVPENGWYEASDFIGKGYSLADVKSVAVDLRNTSSGAKFELDPETGISSVSFEIHMKGSENEADYGYWAYNNPAYTSVQRDLLRTREGNTVRVLMNDASTFVVEKELTNASAAFNNDEFTFEIKLKNNAYAYKLYKLFTFDGTDWIKEDGLHSTNGQGRLTLKAGQRAVFTAPASGKLTASEVDTEIYWRTTDVISEADEEAPTVQTFTNDLRPLVYLSKKTMGYDTLPYEEDLSFTFRVESSEDGNTWTPLSYEKYWVVDKDYGGRPYSPAVLDEGITDGNGQLTLTEGQIIAISPGHAGTKYRIIEEADEDWICSAADNTLSGTLAERGNSAVFTNYYRWKNLIITKELTHHPDSYSSQQFTFTLYEVDGDKETPVEEPLYWKCENSKYGYIKNTGYLDNGSFTAACGYQGDIVTIYKLDATKNYRIKETDSGTDFKVVQTNGVNVSYLYQTSDRKVTITNDYLWRDLSVTKKVLASESQAGQLSGKSFTMFLEKKVTDPETGAVSYEPAANKHYKILDALGNTVSSYNSTGPDGKFTIKAGQTAVFSALDYIGEEYRVTEQYDPNFPQLSPGMDWETQTCKPLDLKLGDNGAEGTIINGSYGSLLINKKWNESYDAEWEERYYSGNVWSWITLGDAYNREVNLLIEVDRDGSGNFSEITENDLCSYAMIDSKGNISSGIRDMTNGRVTYYDPHLYSLMIMSNHPDWINWTYRISETGTGYDGLKTRFCIGEGYWRYDYGEEEDVWETIGSVYYQMGDNTTSTGKISEDPMILFENEYKLYNNPQWITKHLYGNTDPDPDAELVWRVEEYTGSGWIPAEGIEYCIGYRGLNDTGGTYIRPDKVYVKDQALYKTEADGLIRMKLGDSEYYSRLPMAGFVTRRNISVDKTTGFAAGDLRVVEVPELTDSSWGQLIAYTDNSGSVASGADAKGFMNSTEKKTIRIEKQMEDGSIGEGPFTFMMTQTAGNNTNIPGAYLQYTVYDSTTDTALYDGTTGEDGSFKLLSGQYAILTVTDNTIWNVKEQMELNTELSKVETEGTAITEEKGGRIDLTPTNVLKEGPLLRLGSNRKVVFGLKSEYPDIVEKSGTYAEPVDLFNNGTIMKYHDYSTSTEYILSDTAPIYANANSASLFAGYNLSSVDYGILDTSTVTNMSGMFRGNAYLENFDLSCLNTKNVTNMSGMFSNCTGLKSIDLSGLETGNVTDMSDMFSSSTGLESVDLSGLETGNVTDMSGMFSHCSNIKTVNLNGLDLGNVRDMSYMFSNIGSSLINPFEDVDTRSVEDMSHMFEYSRMEEIDLTGLDADNVKDMSHMFYGCSDLKSVKWDECSSGNVTNMQGMFKNCGQLDNPNLSFLDTGSVEDMSEMFAGEKYSYNSRYKIDVSCFDMKNVKTVRKMFYYNNKLSSIDLSSWKTESLENMTSMLEGCSALTTANFAGLDTSKVTSMEWLFCYCGKLITVFATDSFVTDSVTQGYATFYDCGSIIGGNGTKFKKSGLDNSYIGARIDRPGQPGYFTQAP